MCSHYARVWECLCAVCVRVCAYNSLVTNKILLFIDTLIIITKKIKTKSLRKRFCAFINTSIIITKK